MSRESTADIARDARRLAREFIRRRNRRPTPAPRRRQSQGLDIAELRRELMLRVHPDRDGGDTRLAQRVNQLLDLVERGGGR